MRGQQSPLFCYRMISEHQFMSQSKETIIADFVSDIIADSPDLFVVEIRLKGDVRNQRLQVFLDGDEGVDIDKCASISRQLGARLEEHEVFDDKYFLEVSSPGLDMPLKMNRQYQKNIGRVLKIKTQAGEKVKGELVEITEGDVIKIMPESGEERALELKEIEEAKVTVSFK